MYIFAYIVRIIMLVLMAASSIMLTVAVLVQQGNTEGVSAIQGSSNNSPADTFYGRNRSKKRDNMWRKWTIIFGIVLALSSIIFFVVEIISAS